MIGHVIAHIRPRDLTLLTHCQEGDVTHVIERSEQSMETPQDIVEPFQDEILNGAHHKLDLHAVSHSRMPFLLQSSTEKDVQRILFQVSGAILARNHPLVSAPLSAV